MSAPTRSCDQTLGRAPRAAPACVRWRSDARDAAQQARYSRDRLVQRAAMAGQCGPAGRPLRRQARRMGGERSSKRCPAVSSRMSAPWVRAQRYPTKTNFSLLIVGEVANNVPFSTWVAAQEGLRCSVLGHAAVRSRLVGRRRTGLVRDREAATVRVSRGGDRRARQSRRKGAGFR